MRANMWLACSAVAILASSTIANAEEDLNEIVVTAKRVTTVYDGGGGFGFADLGWSDYGFYYSDWFSFDGSSPLGVEFCDVDPGDICLQSDRSSDVVQIDISEDIEIMEAIASELTAEQLQKITAELYVAYYELDYQIKISEYYGTEPDLAYYQGIMENLYDNVYVYGQQNGTIVPVE